VTVAVIVTGGRVETLQAAPLLARLAGRGGGEHHILLACPASAAAIAAGLSGFDEVLALGGLEGGAVHSGVLGAVGALRRRRIEVALVCGRATLGRLVAYAAGIARRVGPAGGPSAILLTDTITAAPEANNAATWLQLAGVLDGLGPDEALSLPTRVFDPGEAARHVAEERVLGEGFEDGRLLVAMAPGTGFNDPPPAGVPVTALAWEPERFAHLANLLSLRHGAGVVLVGAGEDRPVLDRMLLDLAAPALDLGGELDLLGVAAVVERCDLLVAGDSPLLHLAAAVGTPAVGLFGPTSGHRRGPLGPDHRVVQAVADSGEDLPGRPAALQSMRQIRVDDVLASIEAAM
jgi:ADP-heptose:LPS heptosyltransferase